MSTTNVELIFDGPGVRDGLIDASLLAESLAGYSQVFNRANDVLNGEDSEAVVFVQSEFRKGSFIVALQLVQTISEHGRQLISAHPILDSTGIASALGLGWQHKETIKDGLVGLYKWLKGKKPDSALSVGDSTEVTLGVNKKNVTNNVYNLYGDEAIRQGLSKLVRPLSGEQLDRISIVAGGVKQTSIEKSEIGYFEPEPLSLQPPSLSSGKREAALIVSKLAFKEKSTWTFFEQGATVVAKIEDVDFWKSVHDRTVTFGEGDTLLVQLAWNVERKTRLVQKNTILKVRKVIPRPEQLRF